MLITRYAAEMLFIRATRRHMLPLRRRSTRYAASVQSPRHSAMAAAMPILRLIITRYLLFLPQPLIIAFSPPLR